MTDDIAILHEQLATSIEMCSKYEAAVGEDLAEILSLRAKLEWRTKALRDILEILDNHGMRSWTIAEMARAALSDD
jgi:hypothetical protein